MQRTLCPVIEEIPFQSSVAYMRSGGYPAGAWGKDELVKNIVVDL